MKKVTKYLAYIAALSFLAASCDVAEIESAKEESYKPGQPDLENCQGVYFPEQEASGSHTYDPTQDPVVDITVNRKVKKGEAIVPFKILSDDPSGTWNPGTIKFENGDTTTTFSVRFDQTEVGKKYSFTVVIDDPEYASNYSANAKSLDFEVMRVEWKKFGTGTLYVYGPLYTTGPKEIKDLELKYYEVDGIRTCKIVNALKSVNRDGFLADYDFTWDSKTNIVKVPYQETGLVEDGTVAYLSDAAGFYGGYYGEDYAATLGYADWYEYIEKNGMRFAEYDGNGCFYLADWYICDLTSEFAGKGYMFGGSSKKDCDYFICDGFTRTDFEIKEIETDFTVDGEIPVLVTTGRDVKTLKFVTVEGEVTATQAGKIAEAIADGTQENLKESTDFIYDAEDDVNYYSLGLSFEKTGKYSIIAASLDTTAVAYKFASFDYISAEETSKYATEIEVGAEEIPSRFGLKKTEAFAFYVAGKDITEAHLGIFSAKAYSTDPEGYNAEVKLDEPDEEGNTNYALSEDEIAQINSVGGLYDYVSGLKALTEYVVVVWATNGNSDKIVTTSFTTDGLPAEKIGTGIYSYGCIYDGYYDAADLYLDPNTGNYFIEGIYDGMDLPFSVGDDNKVTITSQMIYSGLTDSQVGSVYVGPVSVIDYAFGTGALAYYFPEFVGAESTYDPAKKTYTFAIGNVSTASYLWAGFETFVLSDTPPTVSLNKKSMSECSAVKTGKSVKFRESYKITNVKRTEPLAVDCKVAVRPFEKKEKAPVQRTKFTGRL